MELKKIAMKFTKQAENRMTYQHGWSYNKNDKFHISFSSIYFLKDTIKIFA